MDNVIPINSPSAEDSEAPAILVNLQNGRIAEVPCGPRDRDYVSGNRIVVWSKDSKEPVIPKDHRQRWRFYAEFCADPELAQKHGLTLEQGKAYFTAYLKFIRDRGLGRHAKHIHGATPEKLAKLWHPEILELRAAAKSSRGQHRMDVGLLDQITDGLGATSKGAKKP